MLVAVIAFEVKRNVLRQHDTNFVISIYRFIMYKTFLFYEENCHHRRLIYISVVFYEELIVMLAFVPILCMPYVFQRPNGAQQSGKVKISYLFRFHSMINCLLSLFHMNQIR